MMKLLLAVLVALPMLVTAQGNLVNPYRFAAGGGGTPVTFVSSSTNGVLNPGALTSVSITNSGANTLQIAHVGIGDSGQRAVTAVTNQAGTAFTLLWTNNASAWARTEMWYLVNPPAGSNTVIAVVPTGGIVHVGLSVACYAGAHQSAIFGTFVTNSATGNLTVTVTSAVGELVVGAATTDANGTLTISGGTNPSGTGTIDNDTDYAAGYWTGAASVNANWTAGAEPTSGGAVSIKPANP